MSSPAPRSHIGAVFLSYAHEDGAVARRIAEAMRAVGVEVWFDQSELRGGDAWDQKIRKQIKECALFVPIISANTQARLEGYFRLEWKLAAQRMHTMADAKPFLVPVCIDHTDEAETHVPEEFRAVQWTRLPAGAADESFCARIAVLLGGSFERRPSRPAVRDEVPVGGRPRRARPWLPIAASAALFLGALAWLTRWPPWRADEPDSPTAKRATAPVLTESQKLTSQARALYERWDFATRQDFALAEQLLKKAVEAAPTDGEAWAAYALLSCGAIVLSYDDSEERKELARAYAGNALRLAPNSDQARFAYAFSLRFSPQTALEAARLQEIEAARQPTNKLALRITAGTFLRTLNEPLRALPYLEKAAALPGGDAIALYMKADTLWRLQRYGEAEATIDAALALAPSYGLAHSIKIQLLLDLHGDLNRARAQLAQMPVTYLLEDSGAYSAGLVWLYSQEPDNCLRDLRGARDYLRTLTFTGPKAYLTGLAYRLRNNLDAARTEWAAALGVVEQQLRAQPNANVFLAWKATLLAALNERERAAGLLRELRQRVDSKAADISPLDIARVSALLGDVDDALSALMAARHEARFNYWSRNSLRFDPVWDPLRGDPRFRDLLATTVKSNDGVNAGAAASAVSPKSIAVLPSKT